MNSSSTHIDFLRAEFDLHSSNYENVILVRDLSSEMKNLILKDLCNL